VRNMHASSQGQHLSSLAAYSPAACLRTTMMTWQPAWARCFVISRPMPDDAPVMTAIVPYMPARCCQLSATVCRCMLHSKNRPTVDCVSIDRFNAAITERAGHLEFRIITHPQVLPLHDLFAGFRPSVKECHDG
jgi:hypothetical protein